MASIDSPSESSAENKRMFQTFFRDANGKAFGTKRTGSDLIALFNRQLRLTKTLKRTSLNDDTFADLVFLASNLPHLHEIDTPLLVKAWKEAGHRLPLKKNDAESIVLSRLRARTSHAKGFFLKSCSNYKITDWSFLRHAADED